MHKTTCGYSILRMMGSHASDGDEPRKECQATILGCRLFDAGTVGARSFYLSWLFWRPVGEQDSPVLHGAINHKVPGLNHDELKVHPAATSRYMEFILQDD
jgi:hypothetical protein